MGLFNHLFKNKPSQGDEKMEEERQITPLEGAAEAPASPRPDPSVFLHPKAYVPRGGAAPVPPGARPAGHAGSRPSERKASHSAPPIAGEIVLTLEDVLSRIPTQLLKAGSHDAKRELRFKIGDLSSDIARGRAVVPLSRIAALCPDIFQKEITAAEDMDVRLPLQKLVEQIGLMRSNPSAPLPEKAPRPTSPEAPPSLLPARIPLAMRTPATPPRRVTQPKGGLNPATSGELPPAPIEIKPRPASLPLAPPEISKALQENILKARPVPLRRTPAENRHGSPSNPAPTSPDANDRAEIEKESNLEAAKSEKVVPFPAIAAKARIGPSKPDEENPEHIAERDLEEKLRHLLAEKAAGESALKPELTAPSHLVTALAEIAHQQSLLKTPEGKKTQSADVSLAQPANQATSNETAAKSQLLGLLRMKLDVGDEAAELKPELTALPISENPEPAEGVFREETKFASFPADGVSADVAQPKEPEAKKAELHAAEASEPALKGLARPQPSDRVSKAAEPPLQPVEMFRTEVPSSMQESQAPEIRTAEVFEEKREGTGRPESLEESVPREDAVSVSGSGIVHTEFALKEAKGNEPGVTAEQAFDAALKDIASPEASNRVSEVTAPAIPPTAISRAEIPAKGAESKKPEVGLAEVFEEKREGTGRPESPEESVPKEDALSAPGSGIVHTEFAPKEAKEPGLAAAQAFDATLKDIAIPGASNRISEATAPATLPTAIPHTEIPSKGAESKKPEVGVAEVFEDTLKATAAAALVKGIDPKAESILEESVSPPPPNAPSQADAATSELAPKETETESPQAGAATAFAETPTEVATPKPPDRDGSKLETVASFPAEVPSAQTPQQRPDLKKAEATLAGMFEDSVKGSTMSAHLEASASHPRPVARPQAEIHAEIAPQVEELKKPEPSAVAALEQALKESVAAKIRQSDPGAPSAMEPIHLDVAPQEAAPGAPEARASVADAPEPGAPPEAQTSKVSGERAAPVIDEPVAASRTNESLATPLVSPDALAESAPETPADSTLRLDQESPTHGTDTIWLSLPAILKNCPKEIFVGETPRIGDGLGIEVPFAQIEPQLASGSVEISSLRFISALPPEYMQYFVVREDVKVPIPVEEILRNLPESERERIALSAKPPADAGAQQIRAEPAQPEAEPPHIHPIEPTPHAAEANAIVSAAAAALSEGAEVTPRSIARVLEPTGIEIDEAQKVERAAPTPEALAAALAELSPSLASPEHSPTRFDAAAESSPAEMPCTVAPSEEPAAAAAAHLDERPAGSDQAPTPGQIKPGPPVLNIPAFRVFAPPPPHLSASIGASAPPVSLAWAGHVSVQPPRRDEPREEENEALRSPRPAENSAPKREAGLKSPPPDLEPPLAAGLAARLGEIAADVAAVPEDSTENAHAAADQHLRPPAVPTTATPSLPRQGSFPPSSAQLAVETLESPPKSSGPAGPAAATSLPALPVESAKGAGVSLTTPEAPGPEAPNADATPAAPSTPVVEPTALVRPPVIRPVVVPPPQIFGFTPASDPQTAASASEKLSAAEPPAPTGGKTPPIPSAFTPTSKGASSSGPAAESQRDAILPERKSTVSEAAPAKRAPDSPISESVLSDATAAALQAQKTGSQIAAKSAGEAAPLPTSPKIALSVPKVPVLHVSPAPKTDPVIPAPEPIPSPPPLPIARFDQDVLQTLFMTDEFLDLAAVCRRVSMLPGIQACVISRRDENVHAGELPGGFEFSELLAFAPGVSQIAGRLPIRALKHFTLYAETHSVSFFERHGVYLCVVHRARSFIPGVREKLVTVADELSKF